MSRVADYTIKGFLYQFNKTLLEILNSPTGSAITVEGIVEDVEISTPTELIAIQCKYHEASDSFTMSSIFSPVLQMMTHFKANPSANVRYILFGHYPSVNPSNPPLVGDKELRAVLESKKQGPAGFHILAWYKFRCQWLQ